MPSQLTFSYFENIKPEKPETTPEIITQNVSVKPPPKETRVLSEPSVPFIPIIDIRGSAKLLPGIFPQDFGSHIREAEIVEIDRFDPTQIPFDFKGDPNEAIWQSIKNGKIDRDKIFYEYRSLGQTVEIEGNRGIPDLAKKRILNFQQHFTPVIIARFIAQALRLDLPGTPASVADNSCGIGRMFKYLGKDCIPIGIEKEEKAYHIARTLFPNANIINDDLINHPDLSADYFIINPPFSIQLEKKNCGFVNAGWGDLGPATSIKSHIAAMEAAVSGARYYIAAMLPTGYFTNEDTLTFEKWVNHRAKLIYRLDIAGKAFTKYGFTWPCSVVIYGTGNIADWKPIHSHIDTLDEKTLALQLDLIARTEEGLEIEEAIKQIRRRGEGNYSRLKRSVPEPPIESRVTLPLTGGNTVKVCLSPDAGSVNLKVGDLLTALKVHQIKKSLGRDWNVGFKKYTEHSDVLLRRRNILEDPASLRSIMESIARAGMQVVIDPQYANWHSNKLKWLERQQAPYEQWIKEDGEWVCLHKDDGIRSLYPELYKQRLNHLSDLGMDWLWPFQKDDVARMSMKNTSLLTDQMGLGKTRQIIALALAYGVKHTLQIVEPKLRDEFVKEFKALNITDYQIITEAKHLKSLKRFNLIAYNLLWRTLHAGTKKTFAKAMRRRFQFIAVDEAHKIKAKDSEQAMAVRMLKARYKVLSTGTPIANYPRNIFSLLVFGWGDATELNHYGYYGPIERTENGRQCSDYTTGTRQFKENFISIEFVTPQFEQTLSTGAKGREMPKLKNPQLWWEMMAPKVIRRLRDEPEVRDYVKFPRPIIETELIKMSPEHIEHYKYWLDNFASWFKEQLRLEREGDHKIDQMMILAHLTILQFASTIPQSPKTNTDKAPWSFGLTTKQQRAVELVLEAVKNGEKIIVFSERPEFQRKMQEVLSKEHNIKAHLFIGEQGIKERNILLDDFRYNGTSVLLATTTCGETGLNIPEANVVVIADTSWTPSKQQQAWSRILRPQQKKTPRIYLLRAVGTIDQYMQQLMDAKTEAIDEGLDYQAASEFDPEKWLSYRDFTIKMLKEEGYNV